MFNQCFEDQQLQCVDCGQFFVFSAEDQEFYQQKGFSNPKRCSTCRANRKLSSSRSGNRNNFNKPRYDVICDACGCQTTVPFEPRSDKPVYCSDCYRNNSN